MIKRCSATLFLALVLLWCFTGTKVEAWKPLSGQDLPDPPYHHPFDPLRPPNQNPLPKPSTPKPPTGPSLPKPNNPSHPGPPYTPDHVFPPYIPVGSNFQFQNPPNPHVSPPWPFLPSPQTQNPPPLQKPPSGNQQNPLATGPYFVLKPPYNSLSHNPKYSQLPPWKYALLSQLPVDSPSEKPPDLVVHPPFYGPYLPSPYKPTVPVSPDPDSKPPNSKPPKDQQRVPFLYYDLLPPLQNPLLPGTPVVPVPQEPTDVKPFNQKEMDQLQKTPSFPGPPVGPVYQMPSYPSFSPKPVDQQHQNPSLPRRPPKNQQPGGLIQQLNNPSLVGPPWFSGLRQKPVDQSDQKPVQQQQIGTVNSGSNNPSFPQLPLGPPYFATKGKKPLPRGFSLDYSSQEPQSNHPGKHTPVQSTPVAKDPNLQTCDVLPVQRIPCGGSDISAAACEAISCCYDGQQCYFGKSVTVQCTKDAQFILVVARDATLPHIDIESVSLLADGPGCTRVDSNSGFSIYQFPVAACGSVVTEEAGKIIYENRMTSSYEVAVGPLGVITRDSSYDLLFQCRYTATSVETLIAETLSLQSPPLSVAGLGPINVQLRLGNGQCHSKGCHEAEVAYNSFYTEADYPVRKVLRDNVYVAVQLMDRTDPNLILALGRCWTTTSANPHSLPQWDILINGCPNIDDRYAATLVPVGPGSGVDFPSHHKRFIFKMFTFVDSSSLQPQSEHVYIHCSTAVCNAASGNSCEPMCYRRKRDVTSVTQTKEESRIVVSAGPLVMHTS